jgi:hypothetical protein
MGTALIVIGMAVTAAILGGGLYTLWKGGAVSAQWSNKLMRLRIVAQAATIVLVLIVLYFAGKH